MSKTVKNIEKIGKIFENSNIKLEHLNLNFWYNYIL